jgi:hypothetical protein
MSDTDVLKSLTEATADLYFMSESDYPFQVSDLGPRDKVPLSELKKLGEQPADAPATTVALEDFFGPATRSNPGEADSVRKLKDRYRNLVQKIKENLADITVYKIGTVNIPVFILGRTAGGHWLCLSTRVVET